MCNIHELPRSFSVAALYFPVTTLRKRQLPLLYRNLVNRFLSDVNCKGKVKSCTTKFEALTVS
jgi:hypothetical protein